MSDELKAEFWVSGLVRRAEIQGAFAAVARKGDPDAGVVLVKVATLDGKARLYAPAFRGEEAERVWIDLSAGTLGDVEQDVDEYVRKRADKDPDLWLVEIEDRRGRHFLMDPVDSNGGAR